MDLLRSAAGEARSMYTSVNRRHIPGADDLATITKRVADSKDLETFLCMGAHIQSILSLTKVVSGHAFSEKFRRCVRRLERRLNGEEWYAVTNHGRIPVGRGYEGMEADGHKYYERGDSAQCNEKSGMFFLLLALSYSDKLMASLKGIVCTPTQFSMDCSGIDKKLVMFDDMSYTGIQASHTLRQFEHGNVFFVCPYIGTAAIVELAKNNVHLIHEEEVKTYAERLFDRKLKDVGMTEYKCAYKMDAYPIWFYHKIADNISSFPEIYEHCTDVNIVPPYKDVSSYPNYFELVNVLSKDFVFECDKKL